MQKIIFYALLCFASNVIGQGQRSYWAFGDSACIKFQSGIPVIDSSSIVSNETSSSIADKNGNPLFSVGTYAYNGYRFRVFSWNNQIMQNGDSLFGYATLTQAAIILPFSSDTNKYFIIHQGAIIPGASLILYYSVVDMSLNSGMGAVISKNNIIDSTNKLLEKRIAVKHGNGRDWWIVSHGLNNDTFVNYLISNDSFLGAYFQNIGSIQLSDFGGQMVTSPYGDKLFLPCFTGLADLFDFDRCTGLLSNWKYIGDSITSWNRYYGACFSTKNLLFYATQDSVWQVDATDTSPLSTKTLIYVRTFPDGCFGQLQTGPDNKIYMATARGVGCGGPNSIFDSINQNLSVITLPDVNGIGCSFQPYSVSLGNHRCFIGLPNIPFYDLDPLQGSPCDTLLSLTPGPSPVERGVEVYPNPNNGVFTISINKVLRGKVTVTVYDDCSRQVFQIAYAENVGSNFNRQLHLQNLSKGIYQLTVKTDKEIYRGKVVKL